MKEQAIIAGALIDAWADRLDSGIPQASGAMRKRGGQCCLGVYADIVGIPHQFDGDASECAVYDFGVGLGLVSFPSGRLMREIGLSDTGNPLDTEGWNVPEELRHLTNGEAVWEYSLATLNDGQNGNKPWTFPQIAALLRHNKQRLMEIVDGLHFDD